MTIDELKRAALQSEPSTRASLARDLLASLDDLSETAVERLRLEEAARRARIPDAGFHPDARRESREAADFYDVRRPGPGSESLVEIARTMRQVVECPEGRHRLRGRPVQNA